MSNRNPAADVAALSAIQTQIGPMSSVPPTKQLTPRLDSLEQSRLTDESRLTALEQSDAGRTTQLNSLNLRDNGQDARSAAIETRASALETSQGAQDTKIAQNTATITTEATARAAADSAEVTARNTAIASASAAEATARSGADAALQDQITALIAARPRNQRKAVPALALLGTTDIAVTWDRPFPTTSYSVQIGQSGGAALLDLVRVITTAKTLTGCTVRVKAVAILATGLTLEITGIPD